MGWVSIYNAPALKELLGIPDHIEIVAYRCLGHVEQLYAQSELEAKGWRKRMPLDELISKESWQAIGD